MKYVKTVAVCAVVALGVGATSATAGSLMTSAKIKDGTIKMRDLSPSLQAKINQTAKPDPQGANGAMGAKGADGTNGSNGVNGRDGIRYDRITGTCGSGMTGEISVADGAARLGLPTQMAYAMIRSYPKNTKVSDLDRLSFRAKSSDWGVTYLKVTTTNHGSIVFSPNTQPGGEETGKWVTYDVLGEDATARWNDDAGNSDDLTWEQVLTMGGNKHVKEVSLIAGCAQGLGDDGVAEVEVDDLTINDEVIDFN